MAITQYTSISSFINTIFEDTVLVAKEKSLMQALVSKYSAQRSEESRGGKDC